MSDAARELLAALAARAGMPPTVVAAKATPWRSATFAGMRHELTLDLPRERVACFCDGIGDAEFTLRGHILADILAGPVAAPASTVTPNGIRVRIEALTIAEDG